MLFFERAKRLWNEFLAFKKYKAMNPVLAVFAGLCVLPFAIIFFALFGVLFVWCVLYSFVEAPIKYLHRIVNEEGQQVRHATQFIIYFISWPTIFMFYLMYAFFTVGIIVLYFWVQLFGYIASLCGYKFHVSPYAEDIAIEDRNLWSAGKKVSILAIVLIAFVGLLLFIEGIYALSVYSQLYTQYEEYLFSYYFSVPAMVFAGIYELFIWLYVPIAFHNKEVPILTR